MVPNILLKVPFLALAFFTLTTQAQSTCSPLSGEFVFVPPTLPIAGNCNGSYFQISIGEGATSYEGNAIKDVNIIDVTLGEFLVRHLNNDLKEPVYELVTHGNEFLVTWGVLNATATDAFINITYEEIPLTIKDPQQFAYENSTFYYGTLGPNEKQRLDFTGTSEAHLFEVKLDLQRPTSGFLAVETGTGRMGIMARQRADLAIPLAVRGMENMINVTEPGVSNWTYAEMNTTMKVITLNTLDDFQDAQFALGFHLGEIDEPDTNITTTAPTTTMNPEDDAVTIFVKGVNEIDFVSTSNGTGQSDFDKLEKHISDLATDYSNAETSAVCTIIFSPPYSCKESCQMTDEVDRGCVKMVVDVKQTVYCGYSNNLLREDLTETHKEDVEAWEKEFGATDIVVDDCFAEEKTWKIFAIFLPVVVVLLFGIAITATIVTRKMRGSKKKKAQKNKEKNKNKNKRKSTGEHGQYNWAYADDDNFETLTDDSD